jgi:hypothetical protein
MGAGMERIKMSKKESEVYTESDKFILVFRIMKDLNVGIIKARSIAESLIRRGEKIWNEEEIIMSEEMRSKFLRPFMGEYGKIAEKREKRIW